MESNSTDVKRLLKDAKKLILSSCSEDIQKGLKILKKVIKNDPENLWAFIFYGVGASKSEKHLHEAIPAFDTATNICPTSVEAWKGLRSCLEAKSRSDHETELLLNTYINLLRLESDMDKWQTLYSDVMTYLIKLHCSLVARVLSSLIEELASKSLKHRTASKALSDLTFNNESLLETNINDVINAFISWSNFLDFMDRPEFCKKVCAFLSKHSCFAALSNFLYQTLLFFGSKMYTKLQIIQYIIDIASDSLYNVEKIIPLVSQSLKEIENVKSFSQIKLALCIVSFFEQDFSYTREHLENLSCSGDINSSILLLKFLCTAKDYESVMFLCTKFANAFSKLSNEKLKFQFILCLMEALSCSNELSFLQYGLKLGLKALSKYGENQDLLYYISHIYVGLCDTKAVFYLEKLFVHNSNDAKYILALLNQEVPEYAMDSDRWLSTVLSQANHDLIKGNVKRALKSFTKIGAKDKCISDPFLILGVDSLSKGDTVKAAMCFHRAFTLRPLDSQVLKHYLDSLFKLSDEEEALRVIDSVWANNFGKWHFVGEKALFASGLIHSAKHDHEKSIRCFKHLLKLNPDCLEFVEALSSEYIKLGRLGIAENYVSRLVTDDPYDLHPLLLLNQIYKLDVNYSSYFNQSIRCLNFKSDEFNETEKVSKLILCVFINFLKQVPKLEESSLIYLSNLCSKSLIYIDKIATKKTIDRNPDNEYLIALYMYIESHFIAAIKLSKCGKREEVNQLLEFCIKALGRVTEVYGAGHISFWKLLGDVLLTSSQFPAKLSVMAWLVEGHPSFDGNVVSTSSIDRIHLSIKCYGIGLNLAESKSPKRIHEFYYDISVALIYLSNHSEIMTPEFRYHCLKSSLESCLKSFKHSDGISDSRWIHSNLLGVIVSLLGVKENLFKEHFSSQEVRMTEGIMLQNYATHLAKNGLYNHAEEMFEQARLRVDMDYSSSWVGQLLMQLINKDMETKKMLQYHLTQIGQHPLLKWILAYFLAQNRPTIDFHGGQYSMLKHIFSEQECILEVNPCRLALVGYIHELMGNLPTARRFYFRSLRLAKNVDEDTFNVLLGNAIRLNSHCRENCKLISLLEHNFSPVAMTSLFNLSLNHISLPNINKFILFKAMLIMKNLVSISSVDDNSMKMVIPLLCLLTDPSLMHYIDIKVPYILEYFYKNVSLLASYRKREFRKLFSTMDNTVRDLFFKNIKKFVALNKFQVSESGCLIPDEPVATLEKSVNRLSISATKSEEYMHDYFSSPLVCSLKDNHNSADVDSSNIPSTSHSRVISVSEKSGCADTTSNEIPDNSSPYSKVLNMLRKSVCPLPLSDEERIIIKRNKLLNLQQAPAKQAEVKTVEPPKCSYLSFTEAHGCHSSCKFLVSLLQKSMSAKDNVAALSYAQLCLNIRCSTCLHLNKMLPLISYLSVEMSDTKLIQKALHLYPSDPLLRKTIFWFKSRIVG